MSVVLIKGGTIVNADRTFRGDVLCENGIIKEIGDNIAPHEGVKVVDATGKYLFPGGIDTHTHMQLPFMGTVAVDDFENGTRAAVAGGTTTIIDFVIPSPGQSLLKAYDQWREWANSSVCDYTFHVAITWWSDQVREEMGILARERGINSFKHFMAYKGSLMLDDEGLVNSFTRAKELGCVCTVHAENGELVLLGQRKLLGAGITGPEGHPQSRPVEVEAEATNRAARVAQLINVPLVVMHVSCGLATDVIARARREGQVIYGEVLAQHLVIDDSVYYQNDWTKAAAHVMSPPFRPHGNCDALWRALQADLLQTTATDHCTFCSAQKVMGKDDFSRIPNGTGGVEERMMVIYHHGVNSGKLTLNQFVKVTSTNAAQIFNMYPRKGVIAVGSDADIVVWDATHQYTITQAKQHSKVDLNIYEGTSVTGFPVVTVSGGRVVWENGQHTEAATAGSGRFVPRRPYGFAYDAITVRDRAVQPKKVDRA